MPNVARVCHIRHADLPEKRAGTEIRIKCDRRNPSVMP